LFSIQNSPGFFISKSAFVPPTIEYSVSLILYLNSIPTTRTSLIVTGVKDGVIDGVVVGVGEAIIIYITLVLKVILTWTIVHSAW
jgi:hypothetical protein